MQGRGGKTKHLSFDNFLSVFSGWENGTLTLSDKKMNENFYYYVIVEKKLFLDRFSPRTFFNMIGEKIGIFIHFNAHYSRYS